MVRCETNWTNIILLFIVHRDLKPSNLLLRWKAYPQKPNDEIVLKISDFGLSKDVGLSKSRSSSLKGSDGWMAPEALKKSLTTVGNVFFIT